MGQAIYFTEEVLDTSTDDKKGKNTTGPLTLQEKQVEEFCESLLTNCSIFSLRINQWNNDNQPRLITLETATFYGTLSQGDANLKCFKIPDAIPESAPSVEHSVTEMPIWNVFKAK